MCHTSSLERIARDAESDRTNARHSSPRAARRREELRCFDALTLQTGQTRESQTPRSEDIIMVRVRARRAGGQAVSPVDRADPHAARLGLSAPGTASKTPPFRCFAAAVLPASRHEQQALVSSVKAAFFCVEASDGRPPSCTRRSSRSSVQRQVSGEDAGAGGGAVVHERAGCAAA